MRDLIEQDIKQLEAERKAKAQRRKRRRVILLRVLAAYLVMVVLTLDGVMPHTGAWEQWRTLYEGLVSIPYVIGYVLWCAWKVIRWFDESTPANPNARY